MCYTGLRHNRCGQLHEGEELGEGASQNVGQRNLLSHRRKQNRSRKGETRLGGGS